jgi:hypothetical protein
VALFIERARAACPDVVLGPETAAATVEIRQRLDGLPLALELAAAAVDCLHPGTGPAPRELSTTGTDFTGGREHDRHGLHWRA